MKIWLRILWLKLSGQWFRPRKAVLSWQPATRCGWRITEGSFDRAKVQKHCDILNNNSIKNK